MQPEGFCYLPDRKLHHLYSVEGMRGLYKHCMKIGMHTQITRMHTHTRTHTTLTQVKAACLHDRFPMTCTSVFYSSPRCVNSDYILLNSS